MDTDNNTINLFTIDQVAAVLSVSKITVYRLVETRKIAYFRIKGCIRFAEADVLEYLKSNRIGPEDR